MVKMESCRRELVWKAKTLKRNKKHRQFGYKMKSHCKNIQNNWKECERRQQALDENPKNFTRIKKLILQASREKSRWCNEPTVAPYFNCPFSSFADVQSQWGRSYCDEFCKQSQRVWNLKWRFRTRSMMETSMNMNENRK
jgi:hypothetical protein